MKPFEILLWRIAAWICVGLVLLCISRITGAFDGQPTEHLVGWFEGLILSLAAAWTCFEIMEKME